MTSFIIILSLSEGYWTTGKTSTDFAIAAVLGLAVGLTIYFGLGRLEGKLSEGADERMAAADRAKVERDKAAAAEASKARMERALVKKQESVGPVSAAQDADHDFFGNRIIKAEKSKAARNRVVKDHHGPVEQRVQPKRTTKSQRSKKK